MVRAKPYAAEPLKLSPSVGAALAFSGVARAAPLLIGAQGCAAVAGSLLARHFRRAFPLPCVAMNEMSVALGGHGEVEKAVAQAEREDIHLIGLIAGGVNDARGDDLSGLLKDLRSKDGHAELVAVSTPDFSGSLQDGWARAVESLIAFFARAGERVNDQVALLPGCHLTAADAEFLRELCLSFGLKPVLLPDISGALDRAGETGGFSAASLADLREIGRSGAVIGLGAHMRKASLALAEICRVEARIFDAPFGLWATDRLVETLAALSGCKPLDKLCRERDRLIDAMANASETFLRRRIALAGEADMVFALSTLCAEWGFETGAAIIAAPARKAEAPQFIVGDFEDLEGAAVDSDLIAAPSGARHVAARLGIPLWRRGIPITDRIDAPFALQIGYSGARAMLFETAALLSDQSPATGGSPAPCFGRAQGHLDSSFNDR
jgi:nitrogenase molybdenum-iron protein NifN